MQPYFFPYIGYWQLMNAVDRYVIFDDVNYIKKCWINRNRILVNGQPVYFNLPILDASQNKLIMDTRVNPDPKLKEKNLFTIKCTYKRAPFFCEIYPIIENVIRCEEESLSRYLFHSICTIARALDIKCEFHISSTIEKDESLKGEDKVLAICEKLDATDYYNPIGGTELYHDEKFRDHGMELRFMQTDHIEYQQFRKDDPFVPNLSIIDVLMFNGIIGTKELLKACKPVTHEELSKNACR